MAVSLAHGLDFEDMFDLAPVSLWMEDYSGLKQLFDQWRADGVTNLFTFLQQDPTRLQQCCQFYKVLRVNQHTLHLFKAPDEETLKNRLHEVFRGDMHHSILGELMALWEGHLNFHNRSVNYDLEGRRINVDIDARATRL